MAIYHSHNTRNHPLKNELLKETELLSAKEIAAGNQELAILQHSWKSVAWKIAKVSALGLTAGALVLHCYNTEHSNLRTYALNAEAGFQEWDGYAKHFIVETAKQLNCTIEGKAVDLMGCYAQGLALFFTRR
jgi:hypothetical protein